MELFDVVVIGAGVIGSSIARSLSEYQASICVLEKSADVCEGTSKANSAIVHAGFDAKPGTWKARLNVQGNAMMGEVAQQLEVPLKQIGAMVVCFHEEDLPNLQALLKRGTENGVAGLQVLTGEEARALEPNLTAEVCGALLAKTSGVVCPFELTLGFAENAAENGAVFRLNTAVKQITAVPGGYEIITSGEPVFAKAVINAAGVYADVLHNMVCEEKINIVPREGEYLLLDKAAGNHVSHTIFQLPGKYGKGVLVSPTVHGNLIAGPTAADIQDKEGTRTTAGGLREVMEKAALSVKNLPFRQVITSFTGLRAHGDADDFIIGENAPMFFDAAAIESPGLTAAPAIGPLVAEMVAAKLPAEKKSNFNPRRKRVCHLAQLSLAERAEKIAENPAYGAIVCRCEEVSEGEIVEAIHSTLGARTLDGVKRRTRAGMGRCQSGFCAPRIMEILARECGTKLTDIRKNQAGSRIVYEKTRPEGGGNA